MVAERDPKQQSVRLLEMIRTPRKRYFQQAPKQCIIRSWNHNWTIEGEQCQKVAGGYAALKLGFLLFL
jgi:hypothetical protein